MNNSNIVRILLADDHELFTEGMRALLDKNPQYQVVGTSSDGKIAVNMAAKLKPDVVLIDANMPNMNGIEATKRIVDDTPSVRVICLSMHAQTQYVVGLLEAGGVGYLLKECAKDELENAIGVVMLGSTYLSPSISGVVVDAIRVKSTGKVLSAQSTLTARELEVLQLLAEGHKTKEIAETLFLSAKTIATHRENIMEKLGINSIAGLTKYAIREGLTSVESLSNK